MTVFGDLRAGFPDGRHVSVRSFYPTFDLHKTMLPFLVLAYEPVETPQHLTFLLGVGQASTLAFRESSEPCANRIKALTGTAAALLIVDSSRFFWTL